MRLIDAAVQGDEQAFALLYRAHRMRIRNAVARYCLPDDLDDVEQEAVIQIYRKLGSFKGDADFSTWCFRVAVNCALMYRRKNKKREQDVSLDVTEDRRFMARDERLEWAGEMDEVMRALETLPSCQRGAIEMRLAGYEFQEMAKQMGCAVGTAKSNHFRGVEALRRAVKRGAHLWGTR